MYKLFMKIYNQFEKHYMITNACETFVKNKNITWNEIGVNGILEDWTVITE